VICLTGDLHHQSLNTGNQQHCELSEIEVAVRFLRLLEEAKVKVSFFISGRAVLEQAEELRPIFDSELVELGGHNFDCFQPELLHRVSKKLLRSYNGPAWLQRRDARRTIAIIRQRSGRRIRVWRNHMYMHGPHTERVLAGEGIALVSDGVRRKALGPEWVALQGNRWQRARRRLDGLLPEALRSTPSAGGIWSFPINIIPDHEHIYHAERSREWVAWWQRRYAWSDDYGPDSYEVEAWTELVLEGLREREESGVISNMIIHPITMYLADRFRSFERILSYLSLRQTIHLGECIPVDSRSPT
jgi:hypothetical protein